MNKILTITFISFSLLVIGYTLTPDVQAAGYTLSVPIPTRDGTVTEIQGIGDYIRVIYRFSLGIGMLLAVAAIIFGAIQWTASAGNQSKISDAKDRMLQAIYGVVLLMGAVLILYTINPQLVNLNLAAIQPIPIQTVAAPKTAPRDIDAAQDIYLDTQDANRSIQQQIQTAKNDCEKLSAEASLASNKTQEARDLYALIEAQLVNAQAAGQSSSSQNILSLENQLTELYTRTIPALEQQWQSAFNAWNDKCGSGQQSPL